MFFVFFFVYLHMRDEPKAQSRQLGAKLKKRKRKKRQTVKYERPFVTNTIRRFDRRCIHLSTYSSPTQPSAFDRDRSCYEMEKE